MTNTGWITIKLTTNIHGAQWIYANDFGDHALFCLYSGKNKKETTKLEILQRDQTKQKDTKADYEKYFI